MPQDYKRTILVTGATDGIGKQVALELAAKTDENFVIIHGRAKQKCEETIEFITQENRIRYESNLDYIQADFSSFKEVARMVEEIKLRFPQLNVVIFCASVVVPRKRESKDGLELTLQVCIEHHVCCRRSMFQVNHLSQFVLLNALVPLLERNALSRVITVGSMLHTVNPMNFHDDLMCERSYDKFLQYSRTQLMNHLATFYVHRLLLKHGMKYNVTANVVDADQKTDRHDGRISRLNGVVNGHLSVSESQLQSHANGVTTLVRLAENPEFDHVSGKYFDANGKELRYTSEVRDVRVQDRLWETSRSLCERFAKDLLLS
ncbi:oxidoreductase [Aphelenchoides avenae]|nr:oxidoreductase [Aphelenchus avenae]